MLLLAVGINILMFVWIINCCGGLIWHRRVSWR